MRWRRLVRRLSFVFAAVLAVAALTPALAHGDTVDESHRPTVFAGIGAATGVHQEFNGNAGLAATVEPVHGSLPDGLVDFGSDVSRARAATYYPGATVAGAGELWVRPDHPAVQEVARPAHRGGGEAGPAPEQHA